MPNRGSQLVREQNYKWLAATYGDRCLHCGALPPAGGKLEIDEIDPAPELFNEPSNLSLLCRECNLRFRDIDALDPRRPETHRAIIESDRCKRLAEIAREREKQSRTSTPVENTRIIRAYKKAVRQSRASIPIPDDTYKKEVLQYFNGSSEMKANVHYYKSFAMIIWQALITRGGAMSEKDLLNIGALKTHASQTTLKRYLDGWCAPDTDAPLIRIDDSGEWKIYFRNPGMATSLRGKT